MVDKNLDDWMFPPKTITAYRCSGLTVPYHDKDSEDCHESLRNRLTQKQFWIKFVNFAAEETNIEFFHHPTVKLYAQIFKLLQDEVWLIILPLLQSLISKADENSAHRAASELVAGLIRGSKHWEYQKKSRIVKEIIELLFQGIQSSTTETIPYWCSCISFICKDRDPRQIQDIIERIVTAELDMGNSSFFAESKKLWLIECALNTCTYRISEIATLLLPKLAKMITSPYQQVREAVGRLIDSCLQLSWRPGYGDLLDLLQRSNNERYEYGNSKVIGDMLVHTQNLQTGSAQVGSISLYANASKSSTV